MHGDEHVIKFTGACYRENALQPDPRFAAAVQTAQRRIAPPPRARGAIRRCAVCTAAANRGSGWRAFPGSRPR
ncbi:hypothetical protein MAHJHV59_49860 [Mycobacterium avium subsp. hominissuis]